MAPPSVRTRFLDIKRVGHLYRHEMPYGPDTCVYCGDTATTDDHVAPISYVSALVDAVDVRKHKIARALIIVPCCSDCNIRAGSAVAHSIYEKRQIIHRRLRMKHAKLIGSYDWQEEEIAELGHSLATYIRSQENKREWIMSRLGWPRNRYDDRVVSLPPPSGR